VKPLTADERHRRVIQYLETINKGQTAEFRLSRMNRVANFRKALMQLLDSFIEARAEELSAAWLEQFAAPRPERPESDVATGRLPLPVAKKRRMPVWVKRAVEAENKGRKYAQRVT
jgi:hypothetical protein